MMFELQFVSKSFCRCRQALQVFPAKKYDYYIPFDSSNTGINADGSTPEARVSRKGLLLPNGTRITALWLSTSDCENSVCGDFYITTDGGTQSEMKNGQAYNRPQTFVFTILKDRIGTYNVSQSVFEDFV